ncbi:polysaccharide biosynthesis tyrosine autokinase [Pendulispora rubella]|uniref:Polysaccharide biosynthesis tyrosine autokinase n=1 Tax=Pendulispora rubella TaxID=2741070 RepID=A0ABZ2LGT2_9BACT
MTSPPNKSSAHEANTEDAVAVVLSFVKTVRKQWAIIVACLLLGTGLSLVYSKTLPRIYQAQTMLELDPNAFRPMGEKMDSAMPLGTTDFFNNQEYYETQYRIVTSSRVLERAVRDIALQNDYAFFGLKSPPPRPMTVEEAAAVLRGKVTVDPVKNSRLVLIKIEDIDPKRAKRLCDAVATAYIDQNLEKAVSATSDSIAWLGTQTDQVKKDLETNENSLHEFKRSNDLPSTSINESSNMLRLEMQDLATALIHTRTRKQEILARHAELSKIGTDNPDSLPASELLSNPYLSDLRRTYVDAVRTRKTLLAEGKGENHPLVKSVDQRISESRAALVGEIKNIQGAVERDLAVIAREEAGEAALYDASHKRAVDLNMKEIEYHRLDRSRDQNEKLYNVLLEHMKDADLARMMKANNIHLVEAAVEPSAPIRPRVPMNVAIGGLVGLLIGLALGWLRSNLDNSIKTPEQLEQDLGITFLGMLPAVEGQHANAGEKKQRKVVRPGLGNNEVAELVVHDNPRSGIAEAARSVRTNLMFTNPDKPHRRILVTSAAPAEGKTTVACSIAISLAQTGQRVCIIDCDLRRPRLHRIFDRAGDHGVTNVLVGEATIADVARPTRVDNLWCIPAGPIPPNPADLFHSERFRKFLDELSQTFDRIVIDSPPLVAVTDSAIISTLVDGTVFVLRAFFTTRALGRQGLRTLADVDAPVIGAVLNDVDLTRHEYSYYHYYYYKREGYGSNENPAPPPDDNRDAASA